MKIRTVILLLSLCYAFCLSAQKSSFKEKNSLDLQIGYDALFLHVDHLLDQQNIYIKSSSGLRLGFSYDYKLHNQLFIKSGLTYTNPGYVRTYYVDQNDLTNTSIETRDQAIIYKKEKELSYTYQMIEMPFLIRYVYSKKCVRTYLEGGISSNFYLGTKVKNKAVEDTFTETEDLKKVHLAAHFSFGADIITWNQCSLFTQLNTKYSLQNIRNSNYEERHIIIGWQSGIRYHF